MTTFLDQNEHQLTPQQYHIPKYESEELKDLYTALAKAQFEMETAKLDSSNPYFKSQYADLPSVIKASRSHLTKNGLAVMQRIMTNGNGNMYLSTRLCHASGQWIESRMPIAPSTNKIQDIGSYLTYVRRYAYSAMVGVVGSDDDDDGEKAMEGNISKAQVDLISKYTKQLPEDRFNKFLETYEISKVADLQRDQFDQALKNLKQATEKKGNNGQHRN